MNSKLLLLLFAGLITLSLTGCFPGEGHYTQNDPAGFFTGVWHGWIAPVSLVIGLFNHTTRIYEMYNVGWWYDFGFYIAVIGGFGSVSFLRMGKRKKQRSA